MMMKAEALFADLSFTEMAGLSLAGNGSGVVPPANHKRMAALVNQALIQLSTRFRLIERQVNLRCVGGQKFLYYLRPEHAMTDTTVGKAKYIEDTVSNKFTGDVIKILAVYDEDDALLSLNDLNDPISVLTNGFDGIQVIPEFLDVLLRIIYQARHPAILCDEDGLLVPDQDVHVPFALEPALKALVAAKAFSSMNGQDHLMKATEQMTFYEAICTSVRDQNMTEDDISFEMGKFITRGWI